MEAKTKRKIEAVLEEAAELAESGMDEYAAARAALTAQTSDVLKELATAAVVDAVRRRQRSNVLSIERDAVRTPVRKRPSPTVSDDWTPKNAEEAMYHEMGYTLGEAIRAKHSAVLSANIAASIKRFEDELRIEWTAELLASDFAMADGTRITWGDATVEQHQERAAMFQRNAVANAEGAARHLKAVEALESAGAQTLGEMVGVAA